MNKSFLTNLAALHSQIESRHYMYPSAATRKQLARYGRLKKRLSTTLMQIHEAQIKLWEIKIWDPQFSKLESLIDELSPRQVEQGLRRMEESLPSTSPVISILREIDKWPHDQSKFKKKNADYFLANITLLFQHMNLTEFRHSSKGTCKHCELKKLIKNALPKTKVFQ